MLSRSADRLPRRRPFGFVWSQIWTRVGAHCRRYWSQAPSLPAACPAGAPGGAGTGSSGCLGAARAGRAPRRSRPSKGACEPAVGAAHLREARRTTYEGCMPPGRMPSTGAQGTASPGSARRRASSWRCSHATRGRRPGCAWRRAPHGGRRRAPRAASPGAQAACRTSSPPARLARRRERGAAVRVRRTRPRERVASMAGRPGPGDAPGRAAPLARVARAAQRGAR